MDHMESIQICEDTQEAASPWEEVSQFKRARPDTGTSVSFLTTRVREPDEDDWSKPKHLIKYVRGTK